MSLGSAATDQAHRFHNPFLRICLQVLRPLISPKAPTFVFSMMVTDHGLTYYPTPGQPEFLPWSAVVRATMRAKPNPVLEIELVPLKQFTLSPKVLAWPINSEHQDGSAKLRLIEDCLSDRFLRAG